MRTLSVGQKVASIAAVAVACGLGLAIFQSVTLGRVSTRYEGIINKQIEDRRLAMSAHIRFKSQVQEWKDILLHGSDAANLQRYTDGFHEQSDAVRATVDSLGRNTSDSLVRALAKRFDDAHATLGADYERAHKVFVDGKGLNAPATDVLVKGKDRPAIAILDTLDAYVDAHADSLVAEQSAHVSRTRGILVVTIIVLFSFVVVLTTVLIKRLLAPLRELTTVAVALGKGDLTKTIAYTSEDEIGVLAEAVRRSIAYLSGVTDAVSGMARGDLNVNVSAHDGSETTMALALGSLAGSLRAVVTESQRLASAGREGRLTDRADAAKFQGAFREMVQGLNEAIEATSAPIADALGVLSQLAAHDLTARVTTEYRGDHARIKQSLNSTAVALESALAGARRAASEVALSSEQISSGSETLAQASSEQASTLEEVSASLHEMEAMTKTNAGHAIAARSLSNEAHEVSARGVAAVARLGDEMQRITESSTSTAKIVKTIDEIAFQTNLLALNAAVEAARAGDAGKGFAVVAEEVRNLAIRSAAAAKSTAELIEQSVRNAAAGRESATDVMSSLKEIAERVGGVRDVINEIASASEQQSQGITQINVAVEQMNGVTQHIAASAEESSAAASELLALTRRLDAIVDEFRLSANAGAEKPVVVQESVRATHARKMAAPAPVPVGVEEKDLMSF